MQKSLTIVGAGAWGSALAIILSDKFDEIFLIDRDKEIMMPLSTICDNQKYKNIIIHIHYFLIGSPAFCQASKPPFRV